MSKIVVRFPPSPTGPFHVGNARTALFNCLFAKQKGGKILFRIEDTDKVRSKKEYEDDIVNGLKWLGINLDFESAVRQSERTEIYKKYLQKMINEGNAYISKETEGERESVIRFKNPNKKIKFNDIIRGEIEFNTTELNDFVIAKSLEEPVYHLAVVVDDFETGVTHIIRGEDGISNTPRQILIQEAIGAPRPVYAHLPLVLAEDKSKLSKRKHGEIVSLSYYKKQGYLAEAVVNFLALLGWNPGTNQEIFSMEELVKEFDIIEVQKSGAIFNVKKLDWLNSQYIKKMDIKKLTDLCLPYMERVTCNAERGMIEKIIKIKQERMSKLSEAGEEIEFFFKEPEYEKEKIAWEDDNLNNTKKHLEKVLNFVNSIDEKDFMSQNIKDRVWAYAEENGRGNVLWPFRMALTGKERSPEPFIIAEIIGKEETIKRLQKAINLI